MPDDPSPLATAPCFQQETDIVTVTLEETRKAINTFYAEFGSWRALAAYHSLPATVVYAIGTGRWSHVSWDTVRLVRQRIGFSDPGELRPVPVCPLHGEPHVADCHGRAVAAVVALAPGEHVVQAADVSRETFARQPRTRRRYLRPCLSRDPETRMGQLRDLMAKALAEQGAEHVAPMP